MEDTVLKKYSPQNVLPFSVIIFMLKTKMAVVTLILPDVCKQMLDPDLTRLLVQRQVDSLRDREWRARSESSHFASSSCRMLMYSRRLTVLKILTSSEKVRKEYVLSLFAQV